MAVSAVNPWYVSSFLISGSLLLVIGMFIYVMYVIYDDGVFTKGHFRNKKWIFSAPTSGHSICPPHSLLESCKSGDSIKLCGVQITFVELGVQITFVEM